jgi:predicted enzyme related to lactoylglutathione lyase
MADKSVRGRFLWYQIMTSDVDGAIAFYSSVVGWRTQMWGENGTPYQMWAVGERTIGGMMKMPADAPHPPHWQGYIGTPDVDATTSRAEALGGKVWLKPTDIPAIGRFSVLADPQGAEFLAFTPQSDAAAPAFNPQVGDVSWHEIATTDVEKSFAFYADLFGWVKKETMDMGPAGIYQMFGTPADTLGGIYLKPKEMPGPASFIFYARVGDLDAALEKVNEHRGHVVMGPHTVPTGDRIAILVDPQGATFALHWKKA